MSCHKETLRRAIARGSLRAAKLGKGYRISRVDLETSWTASGGVNCLPEAAKGLRPPWNRPPSGKSGPVQFALPGTATETADD